MKKLFFNRVLVFVSILFLCTNCTNKDNLGENVNPKKIEDAFYNPKVNTFNNEERKIVFNSDLLNTEEMNFIKNGIAKTILDKDFNKLAGISVYYNNAILNQHVKFINENILGIIVYELNNDGLMKHRFFIKNSQNKYEEKLSLLESMMSTSNQTFLVYKFFPEIYKISTIGISTLSDINLDSQKIFAQKNEFDMFRVVNTFQNIKIDNTLFRTEEEDSFFRLINCTNCAEPGAGICFANLYCNITDPGAPGDETISGENDGTPICESKERRNKAFFSGVLSQTVAESLFDLNLHRRLRDDLMKNYNIGEKYIEYYYAISGFLQRQDYQPETLLKMISTLPDFNNSVEKLLDENYNGNDIIITESLKNDMFSIIADLKTVSNNSDFQYILNDLENDLNSIKNKTKAQVINELN